MHPRIRALGAMLAGRLPALLTLAALGGLAWWGYAHDWKVPRLADLTGKEAAEKPGEKEDEAEGKKTVLRPVKLASADAAEKAGIKWEAVREESLPQYVTAPARLAYDQNRYAHLSTRSPGIVWGVYRREGDRVKKGEVLALVAAEALGKTKADFLQALVQVAVKQNVVERIEAAGNSIPWRELADARLALREARTRLLNEQQSLVNLGLPVSLKEMMGLPEIEAARRLRRLGVPADVLRDTDPEKLPTNLLPMIAFFDGTVVERDIVLGEYVSATPYQFAVADLARLWILLDARPDDTARLQLGHEVEFIPEGHTEVVARGKLSWISAEVSPKTRLVRARAPFVNRDGHLRPNTFGTARVVVGHLPAALRVPAGAVQWDGGKNFVFVRRSDGEFEPKEVQLGGRADGLVEIRAGLRAGDEVVTEGSLWLKSEMLKSRIGGEED